MRTRPWVEEVDDSFGDLPILASVTTTPCFFGRPSGCGGRRRLCEPGPHATARSPRIIADGHRWERREWETPKLQRRPAPPFSGKHRTGVDPQPV